MKHMPIPMTRDQLVETLEVMIEHIRHGDSMEGSLEYLLPFGEDDEPIEGADFVVRAAYRVGNLQGQGGMRMVGGLR